MLARVRRHVCVRVPVSHRGSLLPQPGGVLFVLAVHLHLLGPAGYAAVAAEVQTVVSAHVGSLLLFLAVLRLLELGQAGAHPPGPESGE